MLRDHWEPLLLARYLLDVLCLSQGIWGRDLFFGSNLRLYDCGDRQCLTHQRNWQLGNIGGRMGGGIFVGGLPQGKSDKKPSFRAPKPWKADKRRAFIRMVQYLLQTFQLNPLAYISFGGLQWIQFEGIFLHFLLDMSGKITRSLCPFDRRLTIGLAIGTRFVSHHSITPFAGLHNGIASSAVIGTAVLFHENTFCTHFDRLTNHDN
jgi:hypothetical protein